MFIGLTSALLHLRGPMLDFRRSVFILCILVSTSLSEIAQSSIGTILVGQIVDAGGAAIVGARIGARHPDGPVDIHLLSDQEGRYSLLNLPAGRYEIHVDHVGFQDLERQGQISQGINTPLILALAISSLSESVTVKTQASLMTESPTGQTQASVSREDFRD